MTLPHACRPGCGACCIAPAITTPFHGMPEGKAAGERCVHLDDRNLCGLFGRPERPDFCARFAFDDSVCGSDRDDALRRLRVLEAATAPRRGR